MFQIFTIEITCFLLAIYFIKYKLPESFIFEPSISTIIPPMFIHQVYFWLKNPNNNEDHNRLLEGLQTLRKIEPKILLHIGIPAGTSREVIDQSYSFSELFLFETPEDQEAYQAHPIHQQFIQDCAHLWEKVVVYDSVNANAVVKNTMS